LAATSRSRVVLEANVVLQRQNSNIHRGLIGWREQPPGPNGRRQIGAHSAPDPAESSSPNAAESIN
jgi:hypothetical protein